MPHKQTSRRARDPLAAARAVAREVVAKQWPELADVEPIVSKRVHGQPSAAPRQGIRQSATKATPETLYTFTFATDIRTPEGYTMPRVARVTVDSRQRVVKAITSK